MEGSLGVISALPLAVVSAHRALPPGAVMRGPVQAASPRALPSLSADVSLRRPGLQYVLACVAATADAASLPLALFNPCCQRLVNTEHLMFNIRIGISEGSFTPWRPTVSHLGGCELGQRHVSRCRCIMS